MEDIFMRVLVMFDMPTYTKKERKLYAKFRKYLIQDGFIMLQYSVYMRICKGVISANHHLDKISLIVPPKGHIRGLILTEKQFDNMRLLLGKPNDNQKANEPKQLTLF
ncbi:CRISPR-associated endonuclease Cas2 [Helicobacter mastomyrinus]|uniref:CRISPR-associated endoribonuclease Cas2 n=3 Tax=Helicobacter TaxID=209 RepID=A0ABZ3F4V1_9HELI|nr:CRISPR-associated endonuclease Cas2 [uncultured Helicobacter sp.]